MLPLTDATAANTMHRFRMNWGAGGRRIETSDDHSIFVGDLAPDVTDELLFSTFSARFPSVRGAKARLVFPLYLAADGGGRTDGAVDCCCCCCCRW